jgi:peptidoglycan/LPS O-acetylase OafA/YrhL
MSAGTGSSPEPAAAGGKLRILQALRAAAALLVLWTHSIHASAFMDSVEARSSSLAGFGACGLDVFFVISGFIVSLVASRAAIRQSESPLRFLSRRFTRIYPIYWILTGVVILLAETGRHPIDWTSVAWLPTILLFPSPHFPAPSPLLSLGWSLVFEMYFYVILTFWMWRTPRTLVRNTVLTMAAMVAFGALVNFRRPLLIIWANPILIEFLFGCLIGQLYARHTGSGTERRSVLPGKAVLALGIAGLLTTLITGYGNISYEGMVLNGASSWLRVVLWGIPSALVVLGALLWQPAMQSAVAAFVVLLGDASYSIYLCTVPMRSVVEHF